MPRNYTNSTRQPQRPSPTCHHQVQPAEAQRCQSTALRETPLALLGPQLRTKRQEGTAGQASGKPRPNQGQARTSTTCTQPSLVINVQTSMCKSQAHYRHQTRTTPWPGMVCTTNVCLEWLNSVSLDNDVPGRYASQPCTTPDCAHTVHTCAYCTPTHRHGSMLLVLLVERLVWHLTAVAAAPYPTTPAPATSAPTRSPPAPAPTTMFRH